MENLRKSMIIYFDEVNLLSNLKGDDYKTIIEGVLRYGKTRELTKMPENLEFMYRVMVAHAERDLEKYEAIVEARRKAGRKSALVRANRASYDKSASNNEKMDKTRVGKKNDKKVEEGQDETEVALEMRLGNEVQGKIAVKKESFRVIPPEMPPDDLVFEDTEENRLNEPWKLPYVDFKNLHGNTLKKNDTSTIKPDVGKSTIKPDVGKSTVETDVNTSTIKPDVDKSTVETDVDTSTVEPDVGVSNTYSKTAKTDFLLASATNAELHPITREGIEFLKTAMGGEGISVPKHLIEKWEAEVGSDR